jgi:ribosome-binding factor A
MELVRGVSDPRVRGMITVLGTDISSDLEDATVRVSVLPGEYGALTVQALNHAVPHFRKMLLKETSMRRVPRLRFSLDETLKRTAAVDLALRQAADDADQDPGTPGTSSDTDSESNRES